MTQSLDAASIQKRAMELLAMELTEDQAQKLSRFADLLIKWNASYNLTSITSPKDVLDLHLVDSLALAKCSGDLLDGSKTVLDVGSGGGLPANSKSPWLMPCRKRRFFSGRRFPCFA